MKDIVIKNVTGLTKSYLGRSISVGSSQKFTQFSFDGLRGNSDLITDITAGNVIVNDGTKDLSTIEGVAYLTNDVTANPAFVGSEGILIPSGTTAERKQDSRAGWIRYNSDIQAIEYKGLDTEWYTVATTFRMMFDNTNLDNGILSVTHDLEEKYVKVTVWNSDDKEVTPDDITLSDTSSLLIDLTSQGTITGNWCVGVFR